MSSVLALSASLPFSRLLLLLLPLNPLARATPATVMASARPEHVSPVPLEPTPPPRGGRGLRAAPVSTPGTTLAPRLPRSEAAAAAALAAATGLAAPSGRLGGGGGGAALELEEEVSRAEATLRGAELHEASADLRVAEIGAEASVCLEAAAAAVDIDRPGKPSWALSKAACCLMALQ